MGFPEEVEDERREGSGKFLFPPSLVPILRRQIGEDHECCREVDDDTLAELLTAVFFAGLETEEGEHFPVRVVFSGKTERDFVAPEGGVTAGGPIYRWSTARFSHPRRFTVPELVKLSAVTSIEGVYTKVRLNGPELEISGLAREGFNYEGDPFIKITAPRPGSLSVRTGRDRILDYERGSLLTRGDNVALSSGPVRRVLEERAREEGLKGDAVAAYVDTVHAVVQEMAAHGRGGILVIASRAHDQLTTLPGYITESQSSLVNLLGQLHEGPRPRRGAAEATVSLVDVLRGAFLSEAERTVREIGAMTATDGATLLDAGLALVGFGVALPVAHRLKVLEAADAEGRIVRPFDLGTRGMRHLAAVTFAGDRPGCVVFVASQDGGLGCVYRAPSWEHPLFWVFGPPEA